MNDQYVRNWMDVDASATSLSGGLRATARHGVLSLLGRISKSWPERFLTCIYCHYVFDDQVDDFRQILTRLQSVGRFVDTSTCLEILRGERPLDQRYFHLSFDDGFRNIRTNAAPLLKELGVPAILFVPTAVVGADYPATRHYCLEVTRYRSVIELVSWDELRELPEFGVEIGSHTQTHAELSAISDDPARLRSEIFESKADLEKRLSMPCRYISWPYGQASHVDEVALRTIAEAGYDACFSAIRGTVVPGNVSPMRIPRQHFEVQWPFSHIRHFARRA